MPVQSDRPAGEVRPHCICCLHGQSISARAHLPPAPASLKAMALAASLRLASCLQHQALRTHGSGCQADDSSQPVHPVLGAVCFPKGPRMPASGRGKLWTRLTCTVCSLVDHAASNIGASLNPFNSCSLPMMLVAPLVVSAACHTSAATSLCPLHAPGWHALSSKCKRSDQRLAPWGPGLSLWIDSPSEGRNQRSTRASEDDVSSSESCAGLKRACHTQCEWAACSARGCAKFLPAREQSSSLL